MILKSEYIYIIADKQKVIKYRTEIELEVRNKLTELLWENNSDDEISYCEVLPATINGNTYTVIRLLPSYVWKQLSTSDKIQFKQYIERFVNTL